MSAAVKPTNTSLRIIVLGYPRFARRQREVFERRGWHATFIESGFIVHALTRVPFIDAVYQIGMPVVPAAIFQACRKFGKPVIKHWVGSDVLRAGEQAVREQNVLDHIEHWADAPWLADELRSKGIDATVVGLSPVAEVPPMPLPDAPLTVLTYLPEDKFEFYGAQIVYDLARRLPGVRFLILASDGRNRPAPPNVEFLGYHQDMEAVYARCHVLVRLADHDGMSQMVLEALGHGRYAVWNYELEGVLRASNAAEAESHLRALDVAVRSHSLGPNEAGRDFVRRDFLGSTIADRLCEGVVTAVRRSRNGAQHAAR
jgi:hypothetical protein